MSDDASDLRRGRETCRSLTPGPRPGRRRRMRLNRRRTLRRRPAGDPTALTTADVVRGPWTRRLGRRSLEVCRTGPSMDARPAASYARRDRPIAYRFVPIGRRPVARSAIDLRLAYLRLALREGRPISRARLLFYPAIRVDSPTSPAVACSVRKQFELHVERRAPRYESEITALRGHRVIAAIGARVRDRHMRAAARYYASRTSFGDARVRRRTCASASRALSAFGLR